VQRKAVVRISVLACFALTIVTTGLGQTTSEKGWMAAWTAVPQQQLGPLKSIVNRTVRAFVPLSVGGDRLRVRFSNEYGTRPLMIGAATVALIDSDGAIQAGTLRKVTFGGAASILIPTGAPAYSDSVDLKIPGFATAAVSLYLPRETLPETYHRLVANQDNPGGPRAAAEISDEGDYSGQPRIAGATPSPYLFLTRVDVLQPRGAGVIVVMGTTRTDGQGHWPEFLARRLDRAGRPVSVVNASAVANPLTHPYPGGGDAGLARFDRDVLMQPGITHVVIADAINDIGQAGSVVNGQQVVAPADMPTVESLASAYLQLAARARDRGVKVIAATLMPFEGVPFPNFYSPEKEKLRVDLNQWIRTSKAFDGLIDLDAVMRDPDNPARFRPGLHTANNFAPNDAGEHKIADSIDLKLFR
jgi:hypothetical protein